MMVYLVRHGHAATAKNDALRKLSPRGVGEVQQLANLALEMDLNIDQIFHSGLTRAQETSQILADVLNPNVAIDKTAGLDPHDDPSIWGDRLSFEEQNNIMLVGHNPFMGNLCFYLLGPKGNVHFSTATMACLQRGPEGEWSFVWELP